MDAKLQEIIEDIKRFTNMILNEAPGRVKAVYVLDREGTVIAQSAELRGDAGSLFFAMPKLIASLKGLTNTLPLGNINYLLLQGDAGILQLTNIKNLGYVMILLSDESAVGLIRVVLDKYMGRIQDALTKLTESSEEFVEIVSIEITPKDIEDVINFIKSKLTL
ncbi:hypothetical protein [Vulcanisaeta thermophila]|uniref:hypothetical protein n=1 Tax=Vulcanisaeta thermophila TaxID=867917 RepID=UPI0008538982|nr:hypothetical protein [Vulcanisaeta thermophila]